MSEAKPVGGKVFTGPFLFFLVITLIGILFPGKTVYVRYWCCHQYE
jgi:hypothetical protein